MKRAEDQVLRAEYKPDPSPLPHHLSLPHPPSACGEAAAPLPQPPSFIHGRTQIENKDEEEEKKGTGEEEDRVCGWEEKE